MANSKRGPNKLSTAGESALERLQRSNADYAVGVARVQLEAQTLVRDRMNELELERERAIYQAFLAGVPKARIHRDGLGTTNPNYVYEVIKRWEAKSKVAGLLTPETKYTLGHVSYNDATGNSIFWVLDADDPERKTMAPNGETHAGWMIWERGGVYTSVHGTSLPASLIEWLDEGIEIPTVEAEPTERGGVTL